MGESCDPHIAGNLLGSGPANQHMAGNLPDPDLSERHMAGILLGAHPSDPEITLAQLWSGERGL